ncbi:formin-like protein 3 isoform X2 [Amia ocellicauda]|uniref:formin-like protein 3 isoform X2 n=1 Tax=Amia ocellicauda TaxID=2972642 RepID=UPI0034641C6B
MESMEEFDRECPMVKSFCQLLSTQEFEQQGASYTQRALAELFSTMERQPELCERVIRKRKQAELECGRLGGVIKAKFFSAVEGQMNRCNTVDAKELRERVGQLRQEMEKVHRYAQEAKSDNKRSSKRLEERRHRNLLGVLTEGGASLPSSPAGAPPAAPPPPPPPPPPPAPPLPNALVQTPLRDRTNVQQPHFQVAATPDLLASYGLSRLNRGHDSWADSHSPCVSVPPLNIQQELLACDPLSRLKATGIVRSPGGTPVATPSRRRPIRGQDSSPASAFNTALLSKFRNAQSPCPPGPDSPRCSYSDSDSEGSGFATPNCSPSPS